MSKIKNFFKDHGEIWKFIKFSFTGISTSVLEVALYALLLYGVFSSFKTEPVRDSAFLSLLGIEYKSYLYSYFISTTIGYIAAFIMNRKLTFHSNVNVLTSDIMYAAMVLFTIMFNTWFGSYLGTVVTNKGWDNFWVDIGLKILVMLLPTLWTYPLSRFVVFRKKKPVEEAKEEG